MAIKQMTLSALTGGVLMLGYAAWSRWRAASPPRVAPSPALDALDLDFDDLLPSEEVTVNANEQLVDFSAEFEHDEEEGAVAPEDLGVRWLTRATEAMSPFGHGLAHQQEAEAALLAEAAHRTTEQGEAPPDSEDSRDSVDWEDVPLKKAGYRPAR